MQTPPQCYNILTAVAATLLGMTLSLGLWRNAEREEQQVANQRFQFAQREVQAAVEQRLLAYEQVLRGAVGLFAASQSVERDEWHDYVRNLRIDQHYPGIQGIGFSQWLRAAEHAPLVQRVRREGLATFELWPSGERAASSAILYLEPFDWRNQRALGYDMFSEPVRREAMARARDLGQPAVSGRVRLVQETNQGVQHGFLMYLPVYPQGQVPDNLEQRRQQLVGFVYSPFRMNDLMQGILGSRVLPNVQLQVFDGEAANGAQLLYDSEQGRIADPATAPRFANQTWLEVNGRPWTLRFSSLPAFEAEINSQKPELVLFAGLLVSLLFAGLLWSQSENRRRARQLTRANRELQAEIVQRRQLEGELIQARDHAEAANQAKSDFLANVSHELRTPLTLILAPLEQLFAVTAPGSAGRPALERVRRNALLLLNRVNDLLDFAKAEAGKFELHEEHLSLRQMLAPLLEDAAQLAEQKGCALSWEIVGDLDQVCLDHRHFEKILLNLLSNALKFTPAGGRIRLVAMPLEHDQFQLTVSDSGIGIAAEQLPLLFQRFQQLDNSATRQHGGTGIGLALVKQLLELMGGSIQVDSAPGRGARFQLRLPRGSRRPAAPRDPAARLPSDAALSRARLEESAPAASPAARPQSGRALPADAPRLLIADDNPDMRHYLAELLRGECRISCAANGLQAWALLQREPFDLLLADVMMPELDGLALTARIKQDGRLAQLPVILVTARGDCQASISGLDGGADDYIAKPFAADELRARVRAALRMAHTQRQLRERAHDAGMALLANGILHNLGNVLNGINVAAASLRERLRQSKVGGVRKLADLLQNNPDDLAQFLGSDPHGQLIPEFVAQLAEHLDAERDALLKDVALLHNCAEHADAVLACQRSHARPAQELREPVATQALLHSALELARGALDLGDLQIEQEHAYDGAVLTDRHRALQILLNLLANANQALAGRRDKHLWIRVSRQAEFISVAIRDNGAGMQAQQLASLFNQGASSKGKGHGYGLHLSALWAEQLGGRLRGHSDGPGRGACFTLELPAPSDEQAQRPRAPLTQDVED
ncbi:MAG TPA: CHASE domain-containing protein [Pseudomonas sp.]|nr:CHASE domain-containing protein [Pseudomonas sp.]